MGHFVGERHEKESGFESTSRSRRAKMTHKYEKKLINFIFLKCWMFSFESSRLFL
jgi:hypothetical protein